MRICKICGAASGDAAFYGSVTSRCKECHKEKVRENRAKKSEYYRLYDKVRYQNDPKVKERHRRYAKSPEGRAALSRGRKNWIDRNPEKRAAHHAINNAVHSGKVIKPKCCELCGAEGRIEAHHDDYSRPLDVIWMCRSCHADDHARMAAE